MVSPHGGLGIVTLPYHDLGPFFYLTLSHLAESKVLMLHIYAKSEQEDLSPVQIKIPRQTDCRGRIPMKEALFRELVESV